VENSGPVSAREKLETPALGEAPLDDELVLETIPGAVDYLVESLQPSADGNLRVVRRTDAAALIEVHGPLSRVLQSRFFSAAGVYLGPAQLGAQGQFHELDARLQSSMTRGALELIGGQGHALRFRVGPVGSRRWEVRDHLLATYGWVNEAGAWDVNIEQRGPWLTGQLARLFHSRRFPALERAPVTSNPVMAAVLVRIAKVRRGQVVYDPFCGTGTILIEAGLAREVTLLGSDIARGLLPLARRNAALLGVPASFAAADATHLPIRDASIDRLISNLPFGKRVGSHEDNTRLYPAFLTELRRVLAPDGRAVLLSDDKRLFRESVDRARLRIVKETLLASGGLHPTAFVVLHRRPRRR